MVLGIKHRDREDGVLLSTERDGDERGRGYRSGSLVRFRILGIQKVVRRCKRSYRKDICRTGRSVAGIVGGDRVASHSEGRSGSGWVSLKRPTKPGRAAIEATVLCLYAMHTESDSEVWFIRVSSYCITSTRPCPDSPPVGREKHLKAHILLVP